MMDVLDWSSVGIVLLIVFIMFVVYYLLTGKMSMMMNWAGGKNYLDFAQVGGDYAWSYNDKPEKNMLEQTYDSVTGVLDYMFGTYLYNGDSGDVVIVPVAVDPNSTAVAAAVAMPASVAVSSGMASHAVVSKASIPSANAQQSLVSAVGNMASSQVASNVPVNVTVSNVKVNDKTPALAAVATPAVVPTSTPPLSSGDISVSKYINYKF
jgi:hypothetical protein